MKVRLLIPTGDITSVTSLEKEVEWPWPHLPTVGSDVWIGDLTAIVEVLTFDLNEPMVTIEFERSARSAEELAELEQGGWHAHA